MAFDPAGNLWGLSSNPSHLYSIDPSTGAATDRGLLNGNLLSGLTFDCTGAGYATDGSADQLLSVNTGTASTTPIGALGFDVGLGSLATDSGGTVWMMVRPASPPGTASRTFTVNTGSGALSSVATVAGNNPVSLALLPPSCFSPPTTVPQTSTSSTSSTTPSSSSTTSTAANAALVTPAFTG